ncbi:MAG: ATP-binding protein [Candidatus Pacebacteria bacterium]|nr:ATP-binding protein [Candidatus Paceibacterota bacterium]
MKNPFKNIFKKKKEELPKKALEDSILRAQDIIAPAFIEINQSYLKVGEKITKTFFIFSYPRYLDSAWLSPVVNLDTPMDISMFFHPVESASVLKNLRKKVTEVQSEIMERQEKGLVRDPALETGYRDIEELRDRIQTAQEKMFNFGLYLTIYGDDQEEIRQTESTLRSILESRLIYIKPATYQQKQGFISCSPYGLDKLEIHTLMNTAPLSSAFPFLSFDLSSTDGILYGLNNHNNSLILFDRFNLENANEVVFAKAGAGKSFAVKLEVLRYLMLGVEVIILDPENEYRSLAEAVGGSFFNFSLTSPHHLNPFDLPLPRDDEKPEDILRANIMNLVSLSRIMLGGMTPEEDSIMDKAISETYAAKDITPESNFSNIESPLMSDLEAVLRTMVGTESLVNRLQKFTKGTYSSFFDQPSNIDMNNQLSVFGTRNMEEGLRSIALFIILRHVWKTVCSTLKKRILIIDEAWWLMQSEDGASFLFGTAKRARKYWLGVTTITQDIEDFMKSAYGKPIVTNSSLQLLLKQSPATIDTLQKTFDLTEGEKNSLLEAAVGEGLFFAGQKHAAIRIIASYQETQIITTSPEEILKIKKAKLELEEKHE